MRRSGSRNLNGIFETCKRFGGFAGLAAFCASNVDTSPEDGDVTIPAAAFRLAITWEVVCAEEVVAAAAAGVPFGRTMDDTKGDDWSIAPTNVVEAAAAAACWAACMAAVTFADRPLDTVTDDAATAAEVDDDNGHVDDDGGGGIESVVGVLTCVFNIDEVVSMALLLVTVPFWVFIVWLTAMAPFVIVFVLFIAALSEVMATPQLGVPADVTVDAVPFSDFEMISDCKKKDEQKIS